MNFLKYVTSKTLCKYKSKLFKNAITQMISTHQLLFWLKVSSVLFFLPIIIMTIAYALIIGRLWGNKPPGEKLDAAVSHQAKATRKVRR